ncbi:tetratricopeptide repeat protein [Altererythrobacter sp. RZ02]|uniref:Tetratricopeptide repeat protein n=1 Tax=Pontixanthobacter rizhaonensis TaxID=2730337 RepID=A0A848QJG1_9SPHN|nr:SPOR domain-containing protein [Pontixanthobacter rizhaonensis]NMW30813.1 tetratricopeptide repeat protein [Pontixanthobacter rizhaonensis]
MGSYCRAYRADGILVWLGKLEGWWPVSVACKLRGSTVSKAALGCGIAMLAMPGASVAQAQSSAPVVSRPVVQPLPPAEVTKLNSALRVLARNSQNIGALIDAGNASLAVNDIDAAIGFFGRADDLSPNNPRVKIGLAAAFVRTQRPIEALALFDEAERAGTSAGALAMDRGLAYDLVGDNAAAQRYYLQALNGRENTIARRRFSLSHAIAGNREEFEAVLLPLLEAQDFASYRTRAFGLAILGEEDEAIAITEAVMQRDMAARIAPYLRYMPRLTKAQQAAAANLGIFPRAAQIGRDTPQIAGYIGRAEAGRNADARLTPQGQPLGAKPDNTSQRRRPDRGGSAVEPVRLAAVEAIPSAGASTATSPAATPAAPIAAPATPTPEPAALTPEPTPEPVTPVPAPVAVAQAASGTASSSVAVREEASGFDLADVAQPIATTSNPVVQPIPPKPESVAEAFANLSLETVPAAKPTGGVDITAIKPPREVAQKPVAEKKAEPEKPKHPRRFWVQIATGKDRSALRFDWRRISRKADGDLEGKGPFVTPWGQSNRLLAGPYSTSKAARNAMNSLKENDIDSFTFTSPEGQEIEKLR